MLSNFDYTLDKMRNFALNALISSVLRIYLGIQ